MYLLADSGSTKCDWVIVDDQFNEVARPMTMGFNPYFHSEAIISTAVKQNEKLSAYADEIKEVFYYGAGCSAPALNSIVRRALKTMFVNAKIHVEHDLLGAAYATYTGAPGISCILGTGSNSCYFDGKGIHEAVPALGYILGDEGSGSYFGKKLLALYMYKRLPKHIHEAFKDKYELGMDEIVQNVYNKAHANVYLASFVRFIADFRDEPIFKEMLIKGMKIFLEIHVKCYPQSRTVPVHFVGSVAFYYQDAIREAASEMGLTIGQIVRKPIDNLIRYHADEVLKVAN